MIATQSDAVAAVTNEYNWESEFETVSNFIRRERLKIENSGIKLKLWNKLRVPPVVMKIRWIIHVVTAKFFVDRAHHIKLFLNFLAAVTCKPRPFFPDSDNPIDPVTTEMS